MVTVPVVVLMALSAVAIIGVIVLSVKIVCRCYRMYASSPIFEGTRVKNLPRIPQNSIHPCYRDSQQALGLQRKCNYERSSVPRYYQHHLYEMQQQRPPLHYDQHHLYEMQEQRPPMYYVPNY